MIRRMHKEVRVNSLLAEIVLHVIINGKHGSNLPALAEKLVNEIRDDARWKLVKRDPKRERLLKRLVLIWDDPNFLPQDEDAAVQALVDHVKSKGRRKR